MKIILNILILLYGIEFTESSTFNINAATVLLPHTSIGSEPVLYTLKISGEDGCFSYTNSRDDLIEVTSKRQISPDNGQSSCAVEIQMKTVSNATSRETSIITLYDNFRGYVIRTHVILASIVRLEILTRTRNLYVGDYKEKIEVVGYDSFGNIYNSLTGPRFEWTIKCLNNSNCKNRVPVSLAQFSSSNYDADSYILALESRGHKGNVVLIDPISQGEVDLSVRCLDPYYSLLVADVRLTIREYILLQPNENIYAIQGSYTLFQAFRMVRGKLDEINLPSKSYFLTSSNASVASLLTDEKTIFSKNLGVSTISIIDKSNSLQSNVRNDFQVLLHVIDPTHMIFHVENQENWVMEVNNVYDFSLLFRYHERLLNVSQLSFNLTVQTSSNVSKITHSPNSLNFTLEITNSGSFEIFATVYGFTTKFKNQRVFSYPITASILIQTVQPITLEPSLIIFPYINSKYSYQEFKINGYGGSGRYIWKSSPYNTFLKINYMGHISSHLQEGVYDIICADEMSKYVTSSSILKILRISSILLTSPVLDIPINDMVYINIKIFVIDPNSNNEIEATYLYTIPYTITFTNPKIFELCATQPNNKSTLCLLSKSIGFTNITVSIDEEPIHVFSSIKLSSFNHLRVTNDIDSTIPGSHTYITLTNGPSSWFSNKYYYPTLEVKYDQKYFTTNLQKREYDSSKITILQFTCIQPGNENIQLIVYNEMYPSFIEDNLNITLTCFHPDDIKFRIVPNYESLQCFNSDHLLLGTGINTIPFILQSVSNSNILDISSLKITIHPFPFHLRSYIKYTIKSPIPLSNRELYRKASGILTIKSKISRKFKIFIMFSQNDSSLYKIRTILPLYIVPNISTESSNIVILNHNLNHINIPVIGGSGFSSIRSSTDVVEITNTLGHNLDIKPIKSGASTIYIKDLCCRNIPEFSLAAHVTSISHINVIYPRKLVTNISGALEIYVFNDFNELVNRNDKIFVNIYFRYKTTNKLTIIPSIGGSNDFFLYSIFGDHPSLVNFAVEVSLMNKSLIYEQIEIEIFDPVILIPNVINLTPGIVIQLLTKGGPSIGSLIKFEVGDKGVITLDHGNTLLALKNGNDNLSVICYQHNATFGDRIVYSRYSVNVIVSKVSRIGISLINNRFFEYSVVPASIIIYNENGLISSPLKYPNTLNVIWTIDDTTVLSLSNNERNDFHVLLEMKKSGTATLMLKLIIGNQEYSTSQLIYVIQSFELSLKCNSNLLLPVNAEYKLYNNWRSPATINYNFVTKVSSDFKLDKNTGVIVTPKFPSSAVIMAEIKDSARDPVIIQQLSSILIEVASIGIIYLTPLKLKHSSHNNYPVGSLIKYYIYIIDTFGRNFDYFPESLINITIIPSGVVHLIDIKDRIVSLKAINSGSVRLEINIGSDYNFNYFTLINIHNPVTFSKINLQVTDLYLLNVTTDYSDQFHWISSNPEVASLSVINNSVLILALSPGDSIITLIVNDISYVAASINIMPIKKISFKSSNNYISDYYDSKFYHDLDTNVLDGPNTITPSFAQYPFSCELKVKKNQSLVEFITVPSINPLTKHLSCLIQYLNNDDTNFPSKLQYELRVTIQSDNKKNVSPISAIKELQYIPKYKLTHPPLDLNYLTIEEEIFNKIEIYTVIPKEEFTITSDLSCIRIQQYPSVEDIHKINLSIDITSCFPIPNSLRSQLSITRPKTNQQAILNILIKYPASSNHGINYQNMPQQNSIFNKVACSIIIIFLTIIICFYQKILKTYNYFKYFISPVYSSSSETVKPLIDENNNRFFQFNASNSMLDTRISESSDEKDLTKELYTHKKQQLLIDFS